MKQNINFVNTFFGESMKIVKKIVFFLLSLFIVICLLYFVCYLIPSPQMMRSNEIILYDKNDEEVMITHFENEDKYLEINEINEEFIYAFIASEDESFYNHIGFSLKGIFRALYSNITSNSTQGGSTISQQLARSLFLDNEKSIVRKIKEALLTIRLETHYDKQEIIEQYLNTIYLGHNIYGIEQASNYYFNKSNTELSLDEVCMIVGIANAPNINAPDINYDNAIIRRNYVLERLYKLEYINNIDYIKYLNKETIMNYNKITHKNIVTPYFFYTKNLLNNLGLYTKKVLAKGLKVYTTIDYDIQKSLYDNINQYCPNDNSQISSVVMDSHSGDVLAMIGSYDLNDEYNRAILSSRPIGSTIKPLLYYLALKCGMSPDTYMSCNQMTFNIKGYEPYTPTNASNSYSSKKINMIEAIGLSDNIYATKTLLYVGFENFEKILSLYDIDINCVPSSALGVDETSLLNLVSIYNSFSTLGTYYYPRIIRKITDSSGTILYINNTKAKKVLDKPYVYLLNQMLLAPFDKNLTSYTTPTLLNYQTNFHYAAKTGTDNYNSYAIGYNPTYTIGVWTGTDNNEPFRYKNISKKVFQKTANEITNKNLWYNPPSYIKEIDINSSKYWVFK